MSFSYETAGKGLNRMFIGEILCIVGTFIPLVGGFLVLAGFIVNLVGLYTAGQADGGYHTAFVLTIVRMIASLFSALLPLLSIIGSALSIMITYLVCTTSARLLTEKGDLETAARGLLVWKLYLACMVVSILCVVLALIPALFGLAVAVVLVTLIASLVGGILYLVFLYRASNSLLH